MFVNLLECVVYLFAAYGMFVMIYGAFDLIRLRIAGRRPEVRVVLLVRNAEDQIEHIVRNAVKKEYASRSLSDKKLTIVDMGSEDHTYQLLKRLQSSFANMEVLSNEEKDRIYEDFSIFSPCGK